MRKHTCGETANRVPYPPPGVLRGHDCSASPSVRETRRFHSNARNQNGRGGADFAPYAKAASRFSS
jgi:hypothetical protein